MYKFSPARRGACQRRQLVAASVRSVVQPLEGRTLLAVSLISDINLGPGDSNPQNAIVWKDKLYFTADDGINGRELWLSDGTPAGTKMVADIGPGAGAGNPTNLTIFNDALYFIANNGAGTKLWKTDGTVGNATMIGPTEDTTELDDLVVMDNKLYFASFDKLWQSNGTPGNATVVLDLKRDSLARYILNLTPVQTTPTAATLYFVADDGVNGPELWKTDGSAANTSMVRDIFSGVEGSCPRDLTALGQKLYFVARHRTSGEELWSTDGTAANTLMVRDIRPGPLDANIHDLVPVPGSLDDPTDSLFFTAHSSSAWELWRTNGTAAGTALVKGFGISGSLQELELYRAGSTFYFRAPDRNATQGIELWRSDGLTSGTVLLKDINHGIDDSTPHSFVAGASYVYFAASRRGTGIELYRTDDTAGAVRLTDLNPLAADAMVQNLGFIGDTLFFAATDGTRGLELYKWVEDGAPDVYADGGGPYNVNENESIQLTGSATANVPANFTYDWDLDGDGVFGETGADATRGDEVGASVTFLGTGTDGNFDFPVTLRAQGGGLVGYDPIVINILNVPPVVTIGGEPRNYKGLVYTLNLSTTDPGPDTVTHWTIDWGDGDPQVVNGSPPTVDHIYAAANLYKVTAVATDEDGDWTSNDHMVTVYPEGGTVQGLIFDDDNRNGIQDPLEQPVPNARVYVDANGDGRWDGREQSTVTDADGLYTLNAVPVGTATISLMAPPGWLPVLPANLAHYIPIVNGQTAAGVDFAIIRAGSVGGMVYEDINADGARNLPEDAGVPSMLVFIDENKDGAFNPAEMSITTNPAGGFTFNNLYPGDYRIMALQTSGWIRTAPLEGYIDVVVSQGDALASQNLGLVRVGNISGTVFESPDDDGNFDAGEVGLAGRTVFVDYNVNGEMEPTEPRVVTADDGSYLLTDIRTGLQTIRQILPVDWRQISPLFNGAQMAPVYGGQTTTGKNFADFHLAEIDGVVFSDADMDGQQDPGEAPAAGWRIYADMDGDGKFDAGEPFALSDASGAYALTNVEPGARSVRLELQTGWRYSNPVTGLRTLALAQGDIISSADYGITRAADITGTLYNDVNANGSQDDGDGGLGGWTVFIDNDDDGVVDAGEPTATTDSVGQYSFRDVLPGTYHLRRVLPNGWMATNPSDKADVTVTASQLAQDNDFGQVRVGRINGRVFYDVNSDGRRNPGERGVANRTVFIDDNDNNTLDPGELTATTNADGEYTFLNLLIGAYHVRGDAVIGWRFTGSRYHEVAITGAANITGCDIGATDTSTITGRVFLDTNGNGRFDPREKGLASWRIFVDANRDGVWNKGEKSVLTGIGGAYSITGLKAGRHTVRVVPVRGFASTSLKPMVIVPLNSASSGVALFGMRKIRAR